MKKINYLFLPLLVFLLFGMISTATAQGLVNFGIKGGLNITNITNVDYDTDPRNGFTIGASIDFSIPAAPIGIETGAYYSQKGAKASDGGFTSNLKIDYIEVPVLAKINLGPPGPISPHLIAGPYAGFNINADAEVSDGSGSVSGDVSDDVEDIEFGGMAGLGLEFNLAVTKLSAQFRYSAGFTSIYSDDSSDGKNAVFSVVVGIGF